MSPWQSLRNQMPVCRRLAYFDHAAVAPLPEPARAMIAAWADDVAWHGDRNWARWQAALAQVRRLAAGLLGADEEEIALVRNTTEGVTLVAEGFPWQVGDNVVLPAAEFPSNRFPWTNLASRGVEARLVASPRGRIGLDDLARACDARTRIVAVSWVDYASGWRSDPSALAELAHDRGALLFLDAIQGLGVLPLDVKAAGIDFLAADGHKWLLGPEGAGIFYTRREHLDLLRPVGVGWNSVTPTPDYASMELDLPTTAARYEGGTYPVATFVGLAESLKLLTQTPVEATAEQLLRVTDVLCERLRSAGAEIISDRTGDRASGIVAFDLRGQDPHTIRRRCRDADVILNYRDGHLRASPHVYSDEDDVDRLVEAIGGVVG